MNKIIIFLILLTISIADSSDKVIKIDNMYVEGERAFGSNRNSVIPDDETPKGSTNLVFDIKLSDLGYLKNKVSGLYTDRQYRQTTLNTEIGTEVFNDTEIYIRHMSTHTLDASKTDKFPEENVIGLRYYLIRR